MEEEKITTEDILEEEEFIEEDLESEEMPEDIMSKIGGFFAFLGRTTIQYFKNLPNSISNRIKAKIADYRRNIRYL